MALMWGQHLNSWWWYQHKMELDWDRHGLQNSHTIETLCAVSKGSAGPLMMTLLIHIILVASKIHLAHFAHLPKFLLALISCYPDFIVFSEPNYLRICWPIFTIFSSYETSLSANDWSEPLFWFLKGCCRGNQFSEQIVKNYYRLFCSEPNYLRICLPVFTVFAPK